MNSRYDQKEKSNRSRSCVSACLVGLLVLPLSGVGVPVMTNSVWADQTDRAQADSSNSGQITAVGLTFLEVERRSFRYDPKLEIRTEGGQPMELTQLQAGMGVRLQLKEGNIYKILVLNPK